MKNIIPIALCACAVFFISVKSECGDTKCADKIILDILKDTSVVENIDIKLEVPKFQQIKNVGIEDLNKILLHLTSWFENRLNETSFIFKHVNNKTKIFVKSFDFNVDFENGNAKIDVDLTEEPNDTKHDKKIVTKENINKEKVVKTTTTRTTNTTKKQKKHQKNNTDTIDMAIEKLGVEADNEIFKLEEFDTTYYDENEDNSTDYPIIDYVEMYKDTTNEENVYTTEASIAIEDIISGNYDHNSTSTEKSVRASTSSVNSDPICHGNSTCQNFAKSVFPWVVTIFVNNNTKESQFSYYCDGALLTEKVILTDARCMYNSNKTWDSENVLVFLGKGNLQSFGGSERVQKVKEIIIHPNFTANAEGKAENDLALLIMEEAVEFKDNIQSACVFQDDEGEEAATTAWALNGALIPIFFEKNRSETCFNKDDDVFCATYGNEVALCPSYGGVYASRQADRWCLQGIFYGDPADRGLCFTKNVFYTSLRNYLRWIDDSVEMYKNDVL